MSYRSKKEVLATIGTRIRVRNGKPYTVYDAYFGYDPYSKKQKRLQSTDKSDLIAQVERFYIEHRIGGDAAARLKPHEASDAREALDLLAASNEHISLTECVKRFLSGSTVGNRASFVAFQDALEKFLKSQIGKTDVYIRGLRSHIGSFMDDFGPERSVSEVSATDVTNSLKKRVLKEDNPKTWKTYNNHLGDIKNFFNWCTRSEQGYLDKNPIWDVKKLVIAYKDPDYVKAEDIGSLFTVIAKHSKTDLADAVLSFFCGLRQDEIKRVREGKKAVNVDVANGFIRVVKCKGATKGIRPRTFNIPEPALTWMRSFDFDSAIMKKNNYFRRHLVKYAAEAEIKLPGNAGRHTFITMFAAAYHDQPLLTSIVGNTEGVRANSYDGMEIEANGKAYFSITPESLGLKL